jgi:hypothetical protein
LTKTQASRLHPIATLFDWGFVEEKMVLSQVNDRLGRGTGCPYTRVVSIRPPRSALSARHSEDGVRRAAIVGSWPSGSSEGGASGQSHTRRWSETERSASALGAAAKRLDSGWFAPAPSSWTPFKMLGLNTGGTAWQIWVPLHQWRWAGQKQTRPGAQENGNHEVTGSIPVSSTNFLNEMAGRQFR